MTLALVVVDVQLDFCEGGSLAVPGGAGVAAAIGSLLTEGGWAHVVASRDYHVDPGAHFSGQPDYVDTWPPHCVVGTPGAQFHPALDLAAVEAIFSKGEHTAAYSGFEGHTATGESLAEWLRGRGVDELEVVGLATDHCVRATALDAMRAGFATRVPLQLTAGVARASTHAAVEQLREAGVAISGEPVLAPDKP